MTGYGAAGRAAWVMAGGVLLIAACSNGGALTRGPSHAGHASPVSACLTKFAPSIDGHGPVDATVAGRDIASTYGRFFNPSASLAEKERLLQNGPALARVLEGFTGSPLAANTSVAVTDVEFTSATTAAVTYDLALHSRSCREVTSSSQ